MSYQLPIQSSKFALTNNQSAAANITGLFLDPTNNPIYMFDYTIYRSYTTPNSEVIQKGRIVGRYNPGYSSWYLTQTILFGSAGVVLTQLASGQFQYTSSNISGTKVADQISWFIKLL